MKKTICAVVLFVLFVTFCLPLSSCGVSFETYKNASEYKIADGSFSVENIDTLEVNWIAGSVQIERTGSGSLTVTESLPENSRIESIGEDMKMRYLVKEGKLTLQFCKSGLRLSKELYNTLKKDLKITVPEGVELQGVTADVVSSDLSVKNVAAKNFRVHGVSAKLTMNGCAVEDLDCKTVSGKLSIETETGMKSLSVDSVSGNVTLQAPAVDEIDVKCVSADFEMNDCKIGRIDCETVSGKIRVKTGEDLPKMKINTVSGSVSVTAASISDLTVKRVSANADLTLEKADFTVSFTGAAENITATGVEYKKENDKTLVFGEGTGKVSFDSVTGSLSVTQK